MFQMNWNQLSIFVLKQTLTNLVLTLLKQTVQQLRFVSALEEYIVSSVSKSFKCVAFLPHLTNLETSPTNPLSSKSATTAFGSKDFSYFSPCLQQNTERKTRPASDSAATTEQQVCRTGDFHFAKFLQQFVFSKTHTPLYGFD